MKGLPDFDSTPPSDDAKASDKAPENDAKTPESKGLPKSEDDEKKPEERLNQRITQEQVYPSMYSNVKVLSFPAKLHAILDRPDIADVVSWMPHGRAWRVHKPKAFESRVIPMFFVQCKYSSFIRQANGWGFRRITKGLDRNAYYHEFFLRGRAHLCRKMRRPATSAKVPLNPGQSEPDFYKLSEIDPLPPVGPPSKEAAMRDMVVPEFRLGSGMTAEKWNAQNIPQGTSVPNKITPQYFDRNNRLVASQPSVNGSHHYDALLDRYPPNDSLRPMHDMLQPSLRSSRHNILEQQYAAKRMSTHPLLNRFGNDLSMPNKIRPMYDDDAMADQIIRHRLNACVPMPGNQRESISMFPPHAGSANALRYNSASVLDMGGSDSLFYNGPRFNAARDSRDLDLLELSEYIRSRRMNLEAIQMANSLQYQSAAPQQRNEANGVSPEVQRQIDYLLAAKYANQVGKMTNNSLHGSNSF